MERSWEVPPLVTSSLLDVTSDVPVGCARERSVRTVRLKRSPLGDRFVLWLLIRGPMWASLLSVV